jgi:hypothetical protein
MFKTKAINFGIGVSPNLAYLEETRRSLIGIKTTPYMAGRFTAL